MKDEFKKSRKQLRPGYSSEFNGKGVKSINRKIVRKRLKTSLQKEINNRH